MFRYGFVSYCCLVGFPRIRILLLLLYRDFLVLVLVLRLVRYVFVFELYYSYYTSSSFDPGSLLVAILVGFPRIRTLLLLLLLFFLALLLLLLRGDFDEEEGGFDTRV